MIDKLSSLFTISLPKGRIDLQLRLTEYAGGCPAMELRDAEGRAFYSPTIAVRREDIVELVPPDLADAIILAIKPSALSNGIAGALLDVGVLIDLGLEMPADRTWARLMQVAPEIFADDTADTAATVETIPLVLQPLKVPPEWDRAVQRICHAFERAGHSVSDHGAMLAWAAHSRAIQRTPPVLPPTGDEIVACLRGYFAQ